MRRILLILFVWLFSGVAAAAPISYLSQDRSVSFSAIDCAGFGGTVSAPDFGEFDATLATPGGEFAEFCDDRYLVSQTSTLTDTSIALDLLADSGTANVNGGGPARSEFDVSFSLTESTWLQFSGTRFVQTEFGPNVVASENSTLFETIAGAPIDLAWSAPVCEELGAGGRCTETLDALIQLGPGDCRLAVTSYSYVDGINIEFGAYREVGTQLLVTTAVPIPAAVWLFGSALAGLAGFRRFASGITQ